MYQERELTQSAIFLNHAFSISLNKEEGMFIVRVTYLVILGHVEDL